MKEWLLKTSPPQISRQILQLHVGISSWPIKTGEFLVSSPHFCSSFPWSHKTIITWLYPICKWKLFLFYCLIVALLCLGLHCSVFALFYSVLFIVAIETFTNTAENCPLIQKKWINLERSHKKLLATSINSKFLSKIFCHTTCTYKQIFNKREEVYIVLIL